ncbi:hypothetical protein NP233_g10332 [Leucocoprinus birnbaumii]|uniref:Uncharacterized protein n=1 Tax=Leucocoprinus birnbaumii TaxID=56174 RepID=A0AAD5YPY8_9AGAR|nr:hypothetical protein NP233_g10332 [Leucocoprinus birnbaumii]
MIFYPEHLKHKWPENGAVSYYDIIQQPTYRLNNANPAWRYALFYAKITLAHLIICVVITTVLLAITGTTESPTAILPTSLQSWTTFLGITSALLAAIQFAPQLIHTYELKLVGALSIPTMVIQIPGTGMMVAGIALQSSVNWTSWFTYLVSLVMESALLVMCIAWKFRQKRLGIDDFGNRIAPDIVSEEIDAPEAVIEERTLLIERC